MGALSVVAGSLLVLAVAWDIALTILHPSARGPLAYQANRATWGAVRAVALRSRRQRILSYAGPLALAVNVAGWIVVLWIGFALVYLPFVAHFAYDPGVPHPDRGVLDALYVSGGALTTVGHGDVVPSSDALRLVSILESASGFGAFTAAITYVLAVYPLVTALRSNTLRLDDLGLLRVDGAARLAIEAGPTGLGRVLADLVESHEYFRRFPILYYFESGHDRESLDTLLRGTSTVCLVARWGVRAGALAHADVYGAGLERALHRMLEDFDRDFVGGRRRRSDTSGAPGREEADAALRRMRAIVAEVDAGAAAEDGEAPDDFRSLLARAQSVLDAVAREHGHEEQRLLDGGGGEPPAGGD